MDMSAEVTPDYLSVVVCTYHEERRPLLERALEALKHQEQPPAAVIVVVDHNPRLLGALRADHPHLAVVPNDMNRGLSGARNCGLALTATPVVAFLDDDAVPELDWVARLTQAYGAAAGQYILGVGGAIIPYWAQGRPSWFPAEFDWVVGCTYKGARTDPGPVRNMLGANMSFRTAELRQVGGFREGIGRIGAVPLGYRPGASPRASRTSWLAIPVAPVLGRGTFEGTRQRARRTLRRARKRAELRDANAPQGGRSVVRRIRAQRAGGATRAGSRHGGRPHRDHRRVHGGPTGLHAVRGLRRTIFSRAFRGTAMISRAFRGTAMISRAFGRDGYE